MTEGQIAILILIAFLVIEGAFRVPLRTQVFGLKLGAPRWRLSSPSHVLSFLRGPKGGLMLPRFCFPSEIFLATTSWPCVPRPEGLQYWEEEQQLLQLIAWSRLQPRAEGSVLYLNDHARVLMLNPTHARDWETRISHWIPMDHAAREAMFREKAEHMLAEETLLEALGTLNAETRALRWNASNMSLLLFIALPALYSLTGDSVWSYASLALLLLSMWLQFLLMLRAMRRHPALKEGVATHLLGSLIFPPTAIRLPEWVCLQLTPEIHPVAALRKWSLSDTRQADRESDPRARCELETQLREATWPKGRDLERPWTGIETHILENFLGFDQRHPQPTPESIGSPEETQFCPRCLTPYLPIAAQCSDCEGMPLLPLEAKEPLQKANA